jgi:hypothetical protein
MAATPSLTEPWWRCVPSLPTGQAQKNKRGLPVGHPVYTVTKNLSRQTLEKFFVR